MNIRCFLLGFCAVILACVPSMAKTGRLRTFSSTACHVKFSYPSSWKVSGTGSCAFHLEPPDLRRRIISHRGADRDSIDVLVSDISIPALLAELGIRKDGDDWIEENRRLENVEQFVREQWTGFRYDEVITGHDSDGSHVTTAVRWIMLSDRKRTVEISGPPEHASLLRTIEGSVKLLP